MTRLLLAGALLLGACAARPGTIGALLAQQPNGTLIIRDAPPGLAAAEAGLLPGDRILLIDGVDVRALDAAGIHELLGGPVGEPVRLTVIRGDEVIRVSVTRTKAEPYRPGAPRPS